MAPKALPVRPTTDMAKEGLFNILNNQYFFGDLIVLDLFAGTGNISYEFASRGVESITAVDAHSRCVQFIKKTADSLKFSIRATKMDVFGFLESTPSQYDIIFCDPPYNMPTELFFKLPQLVFEQKLLKTSGSLIIEHSPQTQFDHLANFKQNRKYGSSVFSFFGV